jgi:SAM-dependent methyltransferase
VSNDFDKRAQSWDQDLSKVERSRRIAAAIREAVPVGSGTRILEYGAGTGLVSQELGAIRSLTLADSSEGMRRVMVAKRDAGILPRGAKILALDLARDSVVDAEFDLVLSVMVLHHIRDIGRVLRGFCELIVGGGCLCLVDLEVDPEGSFHRSSPEFDGHDGFVRSDLEGQVSAAGFSDIRFRHCIDVQKEGTSYPLFLMTALRPSTM